MAITESSKEQRSVMPMASDDPSPKFIATVTEKLAALGDDDEVVDQTEETEEKPEEIEETEEVDEVTEPDETAKEETKTSDKPEADEEPEAEAADEVESEPEAVVKSPTLPAAHVRSLKAYDWTNEEIEQAFADNPDAFAKTAFMVHKNRVRETNNWAAQGREFRAQEQQQTTPTSPQVQKQPSATEGLSRIDVEALKKDYGDDEVVSGLIDKLAGPMNSTIEALNQIIPHITESRANAQRNEEALIAKQMDVFFGSDEMKPYNQLYGEKAETTTDEQYANRATLLAHADALLVGSGRQGRSLPLVEALDLAHEAVSGEFKTTAIRKEIKSKVKKRSKSITLKPTSKVTPRTDGKPADRAEMEQRTRQRLAKIWT